LAYILKYERGLDALACGWEPNTSETKEMLYNWADKIIVMEAGFVNKIPETHRSKVLVCDVGPDRWGHSMDSDLGNVIRRKLDEVSITR